MSDSKEQLWVAPIGENFEAWWKELKDQAEAAGVFGPIGIEIFRPLVGPNEPEKLIFRTMYVMKDGGKIPSFVGPFKRDRDEPVRYVNPEAKHGTIITYYVVRA